MAPLVAFLWAASFQSGAPEAGQAATAEAIPYRLAWQRRFDFQTPFEPMGASGEDGIAEFDTSGSLIWQSAIACSSRPLIAPFRNGFYLVVDLGAGKGMQVKKYLY